MKLLAVVASGVMAAACTDADTDNYPVLPGAGGPGETPVGGTAEGVLRGRVCMSDDLIIRESCAETGVGGLEVAIGGASAFTADDGTFEMPMPRGSLLRFTVSGPNAITTTTPYSPSTTIPVVNADVWATTLASNQIAVPESAGSILGTVVGSDGSPLPGIAVTSNPAGVAGPFFDADAGFGLGVTGARGVFLIPGIAAGDATLGFAPGESMVAGITVINGGVTILDSVPLP
jgi:hypothetical protein